MIILIITMTSKSNKNLEIVQTLLATSGYAKELNGCLRLEILRDLKDKNRLILLEEWNTRNDVTQYFTSKQFSVLMGTNALLCEPLKIEIFTVSLSEGIDSVSKGRSLKK